MGRSHLKMTIYLQRVSGALGKNLPSISWQSLWSWCMGQSSQTTWFLTLCWKAEWKACCSACIISSTCNTQSTERVRTEWQNDRLSNMLELSSQNIPCNPYRSHRFSSSMRYFPMISQNFLKISSNFGNVSKFKYLPRHTYLWKLNDFFYIR